MSEDVDGRQTRPADDVGRPDGSAERAVVDGRGAVTLSASEIFERWWAAFEAQNNSWISRSAAQTIFFGGWDAGYDASSQIWRTLGERQRCSEASHGETPQDAEA